MNPRKLLRQCLATLDKLNGNQVNGEQPQETEVWLTRDGSHQVQVLLRDPMRKDGNYPVTGVVISPENGGDFKHIQNVLYPRFTNAGKFTTRTDEHPLDLVRRLA